MYLDQSVVYLKGIGPAKAELLQQELRIFTIRDLLFHYPFKYIDKTKFTNISDIDDNSDAVLLKGILRRFEIVGEKHKKRGVATLRDASGSIELIWFQGFQWIEKSIEVGAEYIVYGKPQPFLSSYSIAHPEMEVANEENNQRPRTFDPVYPSTEKLRSRGMDARWRRKVMTTIFENLPQSEIKEILPTIIIEKFKLISRVKALFWIHFPPSEEHLRQARRRLKFEELFSIQVRLLQLKQGRKESIKGLVFSQVGEYFNAFYSNVLPFELTNAQKRVLKEIRKDIGSGIQMNRLVQGDVGSGKTVVAFITMLFAIDNGYQACIMAPTEILAQQHFQQFHGFCEQLGLGVAFLSGSVKGKKRQEILDQLAEGKIHVLVGTHALIEDSVVFKNLGIAVIDEQHRFGVAQRARLWSKTNELPPHILIMTATPIPRTLAMTLYGDLDVSVIDELPPGRKPITTYHWNEHHRLKLFGFLKKEIALGRQVYIVYPLIEESEKLDFQNLMQGVETMERDFPKPDYQISIVHGRQKSIDKDAEMQRFVKGETHIMIATSVIEVGVNVPNASVMVIESSERFGLSQLHQLRGRVGRGAEQSYCILMSGFKLSTDAREKLSTMVKTNNGFEIAEADLKLRGPGDIEGTRQSGILNLSIANLAEDGAILQAARDSAIELLEQDPYLQLNENQELREYIESQRNSGFWSNIS